MPGHNSLNHTYQLIAPCMPQRYFKTFMNIVIFFPPKKKKKSLVVSHLLNKYSNHSERKNNDSAPHKDKVLILPSLLFIAITIIRKPFLLGALQLLILPGSVFRSSSFLLVRIPADLPPFLHPTNTN